MRLIRLRIFQRKLVYPKADTPVAKIPFIFQTNKSIELSPISIILYSVCPCVCPCYFSVTDIRLFVSFYIQLFIIDRNPLLTDTRSLFYNTEVYKNGTFLYSRCNCELLPLCNYFEKYIHKLRSQD